MNPRKAPFTSIVLLICGVVYVIDRIAAHGDPIGPLMAAGVIAPQLVMAGQWWRLITSGFLHFNVMHILFNSYALFQTGVFVEYMYGTARFAAIYMLAMLGGGVAAFVSTAGTSQITAGASGAIMGVFGSIVVLGLKLPPMRRELLNAALLPIILTLGYGFMNPGISNAGHIGGLLTGALVAGLLRPVRGEDLVRSLSIPSEL